ncbi:MAG: ribonuclease III, partial [Saprospiraceae bacterium]|nr:ribonuclease III [Saprospiraceae bacterium]
FGYNKTSDYVIKNILMKYLDIHQMEESDDNFKSILLEWCQKHNKEIAFKVIAKSKYDKRDYFTVAVVIDNEEISKGEDFSKKSAEQKASAEALGRLKI